MINLKKKNNSKLIFCAINSYGSLSNFYAIYNIALKNKKIFFFTSKKINKKKLLYKKNIKYYFFDNNISFKNCLNILKRHKAQNLYCGNNGNNHFEYTFLKCAKKNKIKTLSILDSDIWPLRRFGLNILNKIQYNFHDFIGVPNKKVYNLLKAKTNSKIFICGVPSLEFNIFKYYKSKKIINSSTNILYISTPFEKKTEISINNNQDIFFDEKKIYKIFIKKLNEISIVKNIKFKIFFKPHPLEKFKSIDYYKKISRLCGPKIKFIITNELENYKLYRKINISIGISSTMLYETSLCGIPTYSLQFSKDFNSNKKNFFKDKKGIKIINNVDNLDMIYDDKKNKLKNNYTNHSAVFKNYSDIIKLRMRNFFI